MTGLLTGRTAVVTGGGRGIGAATAVALAQAGVTHPALIARSADQLQVTAEQVRQAGAVATVFVADLLNLSALPQLAELAGTGVTVNIYRPGIVDTAMQAWIRSQEPAQVGEQLHARFVGYRDQRTLLTPEIAGRALVAHLSSEDTGQVWNVTDKL